MLATMGPGRCCPDVKPHIFVSFYIDMNFIRFLFWKFCSFVKMYAYGMLPLNSDFVQLVLEGTDTAETV